MHTKRHIRQTRTDSNMLALLFGRPLILSLSVKPGNTAHTHTHLSKRLHTDSVKCCRSAVGPCSCNSIHGENMRNTISLYSRIQSSNRQECTHHSQESKGVFVDWEKLLWHRKQNSFFVRRILAFTVGLRSFVEKNYSVTPIKIVLIIILIKEVW